MLWYAQVQIFRQLENQHGFWNRSIFLKTHLILSRSLKEHFGGNSVKFFGCRAFSPFKTVPGGGHIASALFLRFSLFKNSNMSNFFVYIYFRFILCSH